MGREHSDPLRQADARALGRARRRLGLAGGAADLLALAVLVALAGGLGAVAAALLAVVPPLVALPFGLAGHRLSRRFGLSRQTVAGWLADRAKSTALGLVLGVVAIGGIVLLQRLLETWWPVAAFAAGGAVVLVLAIAFPLVLLPIFLRSEPLPDGPVADALRRTARDAAVPVRELRLLHMGEKTAAANAMVAGLGPSRRIYVSDTLIEPAGADDDPVARARVVLAHELGHQVHRDIWRLLAQSLVGIAAAVAGAWLATRSLAPDGGGELSATPAIALGLALGSAVAAPLGAWYSRRRERVADDYALRLTGEGETYAAALERLVAQNLMELRPPRLRHALTASHPAPGERIDAARAGGYEAAGRG
jgi:STE24 endopeptidase